MSKHKENPMRWRTFYLSARFQDETISVLFHVKNTDICTVLDYTISSHRYCKSHFRAASFTGQLLAESVSSWSICEHLAVIIWTRMFCIKSIFFYHRRQWKEHIVISLKFEWTFVSEACLWQAFIIKIIIDNHFD